LKPFYSVCITHFNNVLTVRQSLESILNQIDQDFEVVVVDQRSTDGSRQILQEYADGGKIRLFDMQVRNRGLGRQFAFEKSIGQYVIANVDTDDVYNAALPNLVAIYRERCNGFVMRVRSSQHRKGAVTIATRDAINQVGGWRRLNYFEEVDLWLRAIKTNRFRWISYPLYHSIYSHMERTTTARRISQAYLSSRERIRVGIFPWGLTRGLPLHLVAWISTLFLESYKDNSELLSKIMAAENHLPLGSANLEVPA
jgi:glycosyltransferase involved in cell wall biosynthesis